MKAIVYEKYGPPSVLELREIEKPVPEDHEVLIKVHAASINSWDWERLTGRPLEYRFLSGLLKPTKIKILGCDISGQIESVGKNVSMFQPGDEVFGDLSQGSWGGFAQYVCADEKEICLKPAGMTHEEAAATPQAGVLALQGLCDEREIQPGQSILINGAGGGVGTFAIQIAKSLGAQVTGVDSTVKLDTVISLGADHVIDYTKEDFTKNGKCYDLILDAKTDRSMFDYLRALSPDGMYATVGGKTSRILQLQFLKSLTPIIRAKKLSLVLHKPNKGMSTLLDLFESGQVKPVIDSCFPLSKTAEAFQYFGEGHFKGKVVISEQ